MTTFPTTHAATAWTSTVESSIRALTPAGGGEVRYRDVVSHIESLPGFPGWDHWGMRSHKGKQQPRALRSVTLAAGKLKDAGTINQPRRGYYSLAVDVPGKTEAPMPAQTPETAPVVPVAAPAAPPAPAAAVTAPAPVVTNEGVVYVPPVVTVANPFASRFDGKADLLHKQAIAQTRCFGSWSKRSAECKGCPLAALCQQAGMADFGAALAELDAATEARLSAPAAPEPTADEIVGAVFGDDVPFGQTDPTASQQDRVVTSEVATPFDILCQHCHTTIPTGSMVAHVKDIGPMHPGCV